MRIGSLVVLIRSDWGIFTKEYCKLHPDTILPVEGPIYTVRTIHMSESMDWIRLEEIVNPIVNGHESSFAKRGFKEVQPPMDISELIEECQCVPVEINHATITKKGTREEAG